jgi:hypothetical protein
MRSLQTKREPLKKRLSLKIFEIFYFVKVSLAFLKAIAASSFPPSPKANPKANDRAEMSPIKIVFTSDTAIPS